MLAMSTKPADLKNDSRGVSAVRVTVRDLKEMKSRGEKIAMLTAYDYTSAKILDDAEIPILLVGDSVGQVVLGYESTVPVTMDEMVHHIKAVVRGAQKAHIVADMPFLSYQAEVAEAIRNAGRILKEGGAQSVKLEGGRHVAETVRQIVQSGIPVMGHIGLTPQSVNQLGGYRVQGRTSKAAVALMEDARALEDAGAYSIVLELVPAPLARLITERVSVPTIGIGAGLHCDGQVQVFHDLMGLLTDFAPKHARRYADLAHIVRAATAEYMSDVQARALPDRQGELLNEAERSGRAYRPTSDLSLGHGLITNEGNRDGSSVSRALPASAKAAGAGPNDGRSSQRPYGAGEACQGREPSRRRQHLRQPGPVRAGRRLCDLPQGLGVGPFEA